MDHNRGDGQGLYELDHTTTSLKVVRASQKWGQGVLRGRRRLSPSDSNPTAYVEVRNERMMYRFIAVVLCVISFLKFTVYVMYRLLLYVPMRTRHQYR